MSSGKAKMSSTRAKTETPPVSKEKPKKRSLVERELETTLTPRLTSPLEPTDGGVTKSRYGRALRLKTDTEFYDTDKAVSKVLQTPALTYLPNKPPQSYKLIASNKQGQTESPKNILSCSLDSQLENIYNANISLSRFSTQKKHEQNSPSPNQKFSKVYMRKDLLQTKEKEKTVTLIQNMFSPAKSAKKPSSHLTNVLERSSEKYNIESSNSGTKQSASKRKSIPKAQNNLNLNTASVVKTLDFDSNKNRKNKECSEKVLSKNELFELEALSPYQVGDLAWARMGTFPFWPCIVTREPGSEMFVKKKLFGMVEHYIIHVTFFADNGRRSWIIDNMLRKYHGLDEFEEARDSFTPEAKKKDPRLYWAFFISDKKLALWHTSIEEADSFLREPRRLRIDLLNEMLMNPSRLKLTPAKPQLPQVPRSGRITNRNDSDVSLSESLLDTLFSVEDGHNETPGKQRNKSLDVSDVVTACLDNMAAKTGITKIQRQSHMDIWLQKAKSKTPEKSQFNISVSVEKVEDIEKEKPKKDNNNSSRRKKWVPPREPSHKPYSFRKSTESRHLLAYQNEHDYSSPDAEPNQNTNTTGTETPPICIIDQVVSLKDIENSVQNEIVINEVYDNLITEEAIQQEVESTERDEKDDETENGINDSVKTKLLDEESTKTDEVDKETVKPSNNSANIIIQIVESTEENVDKETEKGINDFPGTVLQDEKSMKEDNVDNESKNIRNKSTKEIATEIKSNDCQIIEKRKLRDRKSVNKPKNISNKSINKVETEIESSDCQIIEKNKLSSKKSVIKPKYIRNKSTNEVETKIETSDPLIIEETKFSDKDSVDKPKNAKNKSTNKVETEIESSDCQIIEENKLSDKNSVNKPTDFQEDKESERILLEIDEMLSEAPKHGDNALEKETMACESPTFTQPFDDFTWTDEQLPLNQLETTDRQENNTQVVEEIAVNKITSPSQPVETLTIESQSKTLSDEHNAVLAQSEENNKTTNEQSIKPVENESLGNANQPDNIAEQHNTVTQSENVNTVDTIIQPVEKASSTNITKSIGSEPQKTDKAKVAISKNKPEVLVQLAKTKTVEVVPHIATQSTESPVENETQIVTRSLELEIVAKDTRTNVHSISEYESGKEQDFDDCESEESEPSPEYEPLEEIRPEDFNLCPALLKEMSKDSNDLSNKSTLNIENVEKPRVEILTLSENLNVSIDNYIGIKKAKQNVATPAKSKVSDDDRTSCSSNLVSRWDTSFQNNDDISSYEKDFIIPVNKLTEISDTSDQSITLNDLLNKQQTNDYVNNIRETEKSLKRKSKVNKRVFDEPIEEIITIIEQGDRGSYENRNRKYVTRASKANKDQRKEKSVISTVQRDTTINDISDTVLNNEIKSKVPKIKDRSKTDYARSIKNRSEHRLKQNRTNIVQKANHSEEISNAERKPIQKIRIKIADITVANSSIVLNGVDGLNDKQDPVLVEDVCDTYSLRSEISSLTMCGDDTNDKDFDPETISISSLSSAISDASVVARRLTRKTSFHEGRQKNVATNKDMDRIRQELLQDSDSESKSSSEDIALSELKTKTNDNTRLRNSLDSNKSDNSEKQLKIMITDCLSKIKENKLPKVQTVSSGTDVEYEIVDSPSTESFGERKRLSLRLKKTSPTKVDNVQSIEQRESPKPDVVALPEFAHLDLEPVASLKSVSSNLKTAESQGAVVKDKLESPKTSLCEKSSDIELETIDLTDLPLSLRRKRSSINKSLQLVISPLKTKSLSTESSLEDWKTKSTIKKKSSETNRIRKSLNSHPKSSPESTHRYPKRKSTALESLSISLPKVSDAVSPNVTSNKSPAALESTSPKQNSNNKIEASQSKPAEPMVNGFHESRPSSPDVLLKEPELDTISIHSNDSVSSTKRKGKSKQEPERMKEPEFINYLELKQDTVMDEHPELTYEEIIAYLYKTWQYEESRKSDIKKTEELENANLVKGINNEIIKKTKPKPKPKINRLININKVMNKISPKKFETIDLIPRELPKRKTSKPFYKEEYSDIEDEIEMFEIFKKPNSTTPQVEPKKETEIADDVKKEISLSEAKTESLPIIVSTKSEALKAETKEDLKETDEAETEQYYDQEELYFEQLTLLRPNVFKGMVKEPVCEICEKTSYLVKCKGCNGMFHVDCVRKVDEPVQVIAPTRGRKKKKKTRGRKPKYSLDSTEESQTDEKPQDLNASEEISFEDTKEIHPIIIIDVDKFESQLEAKMKEMITDSVIEIDSDSCDDGIDWSKTVAGKCEIIDVKLNPRSQPILDNSNFKCKNCQEYDTPICFVCKKAVSPRDKSDRRQKCQVAQCHKYYHLECLEHWPQTQFNAGELSRNNKNNTELVEALTCPRHVCHTCVCDDPRGCKTRFSGDKLARCVRCPATYHSFTKCLPAGSQILSASYIVCPRHYEHRPGKVPYHVNTGWCFICALGGKLICCDYCPTSFHADCLNIEPPEGGYMCEDCETGRLPLYGEMVWVKLGHYRWWPGIILHPSDIPDNIMAVKHSPGEFVIRFFGQYDHYWVNRGRVFPFQEGDSGKISAQKSKIDEAFTKAMEHAKRAFEILKNVEANDEESQDIQSSLLPPHYVKLKVNKPCGALYGKKVDLEESSLTQCECNPNEEEPCGPYSHCLNRMLLTECGPTCRAGERCQNRQFEKRQYPKLVPYRTPHRGWGLKTLEEIKAGQFVIEYVGELIDEAEFRRRMRRKHEVRDENYYFLTLDKERMIDAGPKGNLARFMNHCCEPNCETQKWTVLGDVRVGLFAIDDIPANTEVTFNYNLECTGIDKKECMCGAKRCAGYIGAKPKQEAPEPKKAKLPTKRVYKKRKTTDSPSSSTSNASAKPKRPIGRPPKPKEPRELTEIEKDLLIIKNATNGISSDSETNSRRDSADVDSDKIAKNNKIDRLTLKRKIVSFTADDDVVCNGVEPPSAKKIRLDEEQITVGD